MNNIAVAIVSAVVVAGLISAAYMICAKWPRRIDKNSELSCFSPRQVAELRLNRWILSHPNPSFVEFVCGDVWENGKLMGASNCTRKATSFWVDECDCSISCRCEWCANEQWPLIASQATPNGRGVSHPVSEQQAREMIAMIQVMDS
jgi:hypothetical protein